MEDFQTIGYRKEVVEFVAVAKEYCDFMEAAPNMKASDVLRRIQKFIPLLYLKGSLLPSVETADDDLLDTIDVRLTEDAVTEEDYTYLFSQLQALFGEYDEYLEVFDDNMQYSEAPIVHSIAEKTCDIYQDLKNFTHAFRSGVPEVIEEALWTLNDNFELYWGKSCAEVLRAVHGAVYKVTQEE
ncbi:DUF5063 domain-containing protein [Bacteroidia bacterium]|nr:DUF5063 domain-containing protein [Bacteroidia bacterium]